MACRFWSKVDKSGDCWLWTACRTPRGYGSFGVEGRYVERAPIVAWFLTHGAWPTKFMLHACDNPPCVRIDPRHVYEGTQAENMQGCAQRGRIFLTRGEASGHSKVTEDDVREIRRLSAEGALSQREIGLQFGINQQNVSHIVLRESWRHIA